MARPREFDPDLALDAALELFWQRGYEATSLVDLTQRLGVAKASLYGTFGNKQTLYRKALRRYREGHSEEVLGLLAEAGPAIEGVRKLVRAYAEEAASERGAQGCFAVNAAVECAATDSDTARQVELAWSGLETALTGSLLRARAEGDLPRSSDPKALAQLLVTLLQGIRVVGKVPGNRERIFAASEQALSLLN